MQRFYVLALSCFLAGMYAVSPLSAHAQLASPVVFSELAWGGSPRGIADEWFELANLHAEPVSIGGWSVTGVGASSGTITFPEDATIPAYGTYLVANYDISDDTTLAVTADLVTTAVSIPNTKLTATLAMPDGTVVDSQDDPGTPNFGSSTTPIASMERDLATLAWATATTSLGLTDATQLGTPGSAMIPTTAAVVSEASDETSSTPSIAGGETSDSPPTTGELEGADPITNFAPESNPTEEPATVTTSDETAAEVVEEATVDDAPIDEAIEEGAGHVRAEPVTEVAVEPVIEDPVFTIEPIVTAEPMGTSEPVEVETFAAPAPLTEEAPSAVDPSTPSNEGESVDVAVAVESVPVAEASVATVATYATTGNIVLNELFVNGDEWIEVRNTDTVDIDVSAWLVRDASGKATSLGAYVLAPDALLVIAAPLGKLNNDEDSIELLDARGTVVDRVHYGTDVVVAPDADESLMRNGDRWMVTTAMTLGTANPLFVTAAAEVTSPTYVPAAAPAPHVVADAPAPVVSPAPAPAPAAPSATVATVSTGSKTAVASTAKKTSTRKKVTMKITRLDGITDGTRVRFTGAVVAPPGTFGEQLLFLEGMPVYFYHADWPELVIGDMVTVTGEVSTARGERRIKVASASDIVVSDRSEVVATDVATLDATLVNHLVRVDGTIASREGDRILLTVDNGTVAAVAHEKTGIVWSSLHGTHVVITGVLRQQQGEFVLMPRTASDVVVQHDAAIAPASTAPIFPTRSVVGGGVLTSAAGMLGYWFLRSRTLIPNV